MKKKKHTWTNYIPLIATGITVIGSVIGSAFMVIGNSKGIEADIKWIKEEVKELKQSINRTDNLSSDNFGEILSMLEKINENKGKKKNK